MIDTTVITTFISKNSLLIALIIILAIILFKMWEYWEDNKVHILKKVHKIQETYKLPKGKMDKKTVRE